jgi:hypothetical protein
MTAIMMRLWIIATIGWIGYNLHLYRDKLSSFKDRDWRQAFEYGTNNILCDVRIPGLCHDVSVSFFKRSEASETFGFIVTFGIIPLLLLLACLIIAWILHAPRRALSNRSR